MKKNLLTLCLCAFAVQNAFSRPVEFPLKSFFNGANYTKAIQLSASNGTLTDGTNLYAGSFINVAPSGGTNPIVELAANNYTITFADVRTPLRFGVTPGTNKVSVLTLITNGLTSVTNFTAPITPVVSGLAIVSTLPAPTIPQGSLYVGVPGEVLTTDAFAGGNGASARGNGSFCWGDQPISSGIFSFAVGNEAVAAGGYSIAMGHFSSANHDYSWIWSDDSRFDFASSTNQEFSVWATHGIRLLGGPIYGNAVGLTNFNLAALPGITTNLQFTFASSRTNTLYFTNGILMRVSQP